MKEVLKQVISCALGVAIGYFVAGPLIKHIIALVQGIDK